MKIIQNSLGKVTRGMYGVGVLGLFALFFIAPTATEAAMLYRQIDLGMTGTDVRELQTYLAQDTSLYPSGRVTSYFGSLTAAAVARFQTRNGLSAVGRVGPLTIVALNNQMNGVSMSGADVYAPAISGLSATANNNSASVSWNTNESARGIVYYSASPLAVSETLHAVSVNANSVMTDSNMRSSQMVSVPNLQSNTTYYYMVHSADAENNVSVSWPSTFRTN